MNALPIIVLAAALGGCVHNPQPLGNNPQPGGGPYLPDPASMAMISRGLNTLAGPRPYYQQPAYQAPMFQNYQVRPTYPGGAFPGHYTISRY